MLKPKPFTRRRLLQGALVLSATLALAACAQPASPPPAGASLQGLVWQWTFLGGPATELAVDQPASYTLQFMDDGTLAIRADCNQAGGEYAQDGDQLTLTLGATTLAYCGDASLDQRYLDGLSRVQSATVAANTLTLKLDDGNEMTFKAQ